MFDLVSRFGESPLRDDLFYGSQRPGGRAIGTKFFVTQEDMPSGHDVWAWTKLYDWSGTELEIVKFYNWGDPTAASPQGLLDDVLAGYWGTAESMMSKWRFEQGPCQEDFRPGSHGGTLTVSSRGPISTPSGIPGPTISVSYSGVTSGTVAASGLPPGVTFTDGGSGAATISGTPTTAGVYLIKVTADVVNSHGVTKTLTKAIYYEVT